MKVPGSIRRLYEEQRPLAELLQKKTDGYFLGRRSTWHYESRIKKLESFALKLESGRLDPHDTDDLFAATLVVRNRLELGEAEDLVGKQFEIVDRRPARDTFTHKSPECFPFDDLRLYVRWREDESLPPTGLTRVRAEIQVKTFLLHAWGIATHDLVYKTPEPSWSRQRIAYQIRAMLETAEVGIQEAELLAQSQGLQKETKRTRSLGETIRLLRDLWQAEQLPMDLRRLGENIQALIRGVGLSLAQLREILEKETELGRGTLTANLSPYGVVVQSVVNQQPDEFRRFVSQEAARFKVLLTPELELPWERQADWLNAAFVGAQ